MLQLIEYKDISEDHFLIDVRSEGEYKEATINGSFNLPILNDEERKLIGTLYKENVEQAKILGVKIGSEKLPEIFNTVLKIYKGNKNLVFFCARGGMRSGVLSSMLEALGIKLYKLKDGYKGYRKFVLEAIPKINEDITYIVLHGNTGVGKTRILHKLIELGCDVLDLEGCANHRGSLLGDVGLPKKQSQKQFESNIYHSLVKIKSPFVFVEAESRRIGNVFIPPYIHEKMKNGIHIFLDASLNFRAKVILEEYLKGENAKEDILGCLDKLERYISKENIARYKELVQNDEYEFVVEDLMKKYYDPMYTHTSNTYEYDLNLQITDLDKCSETIFNWYKESIVKNRLEEENQHEVE